MKVKWKENKNLKPQLLMDRLAAITSILPDGRVSFSAFEKLQLDAVLLTMLDFHKEFSSSTMKKLYNSGVEHCARKNEFTKSSFMTGINEAVVKHCARPEETFTLVTSISTPDGFAKKIIILRNSSIRSWPAGLPKKYLTREQLDWRHGDAPMPEEYCPVTVTVKSKDSMDAAHAAIYDLDYVRGVHALFVNPPSELNFGFGSHSPINKIMLGGMHTLHDSKGRLAKKDVYWYEQNYRIRPSVRLSNTSLLIKNFNYVEGQINIHADTLAIKDAIVRYVRAYDESDRNVTIQKTWAALESIVCPHENNAGAIVRRCSFMFADRPYYEQVLEHLREYRNRNVHSGYEIEDLDYHCYQLQQFFRQAVLFYLNNASFFSDLQEANKFLDMPSTLPELQKLKRHLEKAMKFQKLES
ncbi:hypothetical protein CD58_18370 [Pseudomonas brassicacearum]|uniref:hypothetical protein n=1 Tax=Pseudomonas brassicacearum TaxID=930166 RepID=UPI00042E406C|nr:hypothetical protein [Pseudomonas brassicacearum]AHL36912.1 hypothetical protein CD58_18370 [Pseudomonas brassicacearum]